MRTVAGDARHLGFLEAFALSKVRDLVRDSVIFSILCFDGLVIIVELLPRAVTKGRSSVLHGIAVALRTNLDLAFPFEFTWMDDMFGLLGTAIILME